MSQPIEADLKALLEGHEGMLVDEVEAERALLDLGNALAQKVPMTHRAIDKTHVVWARALRDAVWLGWLSNAKASNGRYPPELAAVILRSLQDAFRVGAEYARQRK